MKDLLIASAVGFCVGSLFGLSVAYDMKHKPNKPDCCIVYTQDSHGVLKPMEAKR